MIKYFFIFLLLCLVKNTVAQYTVTKVKGTVTNKTSGELLKTGSQLKETDILSFSLPTDLIRVIVPGKGIFVISPSGNATKQGSALVEMLKSTFHLKSKEGYLSGRAEEIESLPEAFETNVTVNNAMLISKETKFLFNSADYPITEGSRFFLQVSSGAGQPVIRPLQTKADTLLISTEDFKSNSQAGPQNAVTYSLGYYSKEKNYSVSLMEFTPYLDQFNEMEGIIKVILGVSVEVDPLVLKKECYKEVYEALGKPSDIVFQKVFREQMALKNEKKSS
ncbi:MAG: hypothetical protein ACKVOW_07380 [Chitinophagaceae bacterium]